MIAVVFTYLSHTSIPINVVGSKYKAKDSFFFFVFMNKFIKIGMPRPSSEDIRWRPIWMKEMLG